MDKITIYTNENCQYCKTIKEELEKNNIKFEEKLTKNHQKEWRDVASLTGIATVPTIYYKNNYFVAQRDYGNPEGLINLLENFVESKFSKQQQTIEAIKTLSFNILMAFNRLDNVLKQIETKINTDEHKSTD